MLNKKYWRRDILRMLGLLVSFLPARVLLALPLEKQGRIGALNALPAFLDTLMPEDTSPSASQLNVDRDLIRMSGQNPDLDRLLVLGCAWLNEQAKKQGQPVFEDLDEAARTTIVKIAEQSSERSLPRVFFNAVQHYTFGLYYAHTEAWASLGYPGPPQPAGFPDFAEPPRAPRA